MARRRASVWVPATSANLGVGFDCLGLALTLGNRFTFEEADKTAFLGCEPRFANENNLAYRSFCDTLQALGAEPARVALSCETGIPLSGGLGSSSTCIVAGIAAAHRFAGIPLERMRLVELASEREGHPDNVAPTVLGGLTSSFMTEEGEVVCMEAPVSDAWRFVAVCPPYEVRTEDARRVMPALVPLTCAVWQMGRVAATCHALETGDGELLAKACDDRLHEPYRRPLIPHYDRCRKACLAAGASAFWISGSGSTMMAACLGDACAQQVAAAARAVDEALTTFVLSSCAGGMSLD
ncbi:homoserine kinase [Atopobiaceae bacterium 24-176]